MRNSPRAREETTAESPRGDSADATPDATSRHADGKPRVRRYFPTPGRLSRPRVTRRVTTHTVALTFDYCRARARARRFNVVRASLRVSFFFFFFPLGEGSEVATEFPGSGETRRIILILMHAARGGCRVFNRTNFTGDARIFRGCDHITI